MVEFTWFHVNGFVRELPRPFYAGRGVVYDARYDSRTNPQQFKANRTVIKISLTDGGRCGVGSQITPLPRGKAILRQWAQGEVWDSYDPNHRGPWEFLGLIMAGRTSMLMAQAIMRKYGHVFDVPLESIVVRQLKSIIKQEHHHYSISASQAMRLVCDVLTTLIHSAEEQRSGTRARRLAQSAEQYILQNIHRDLTIDELADAHNVSREHLTRQFTREYGISPHQFIIQSRIREACRRLDDSDASIKQVMVDLGFTSRVTFLRAFRKVMGLAPQEYRNISRPPENRPR